MREFIKKLFVCTAIAAMTTSAAFAKTVKVEALTTFSTENPTEKMVVKVLEETELDDLVLEKGFVLSGETTDVVSPKRLKRDATFSFIPETYTDMNGQTHTFPGNYKGKYGMPVDKKGLVKSAGLAVGGFFVKGLSLGYNAVEGAVKNEEGNRLKSSAVNVYENSALSYVENGEEISILVGDIFLLKFRSKSDKDDDEPNYEYTILENEQNKDSMPQPEL